MICVAVIAQFQAGFLHYIKIDHFRPPVFPTGQTAARSVHLQIKMQIICLMSKTHKTTTNDEQFMRLDPGQGDSLSLVTFI